jgi:hypothetical protein
MTSNRSSLTATAAVGVLLLLTSCGSDPVGLDRSADGVLDVLFIGNSLTYYNDLPEMLEGLFAMRVGGPINAESVTYGGVGLPDHWEDGESRRRIAEGGWDVVVLQQGPSATEGRPYLLDYAELFAEEIRAVGAQPALYMVWPAQERFFDFDGVSDSYATAAELVDGLLFPAGEAWRAAWAVDPALELYGPDRFHPSLKGTYLAALVMYEQLSGKDPQELPAAIPVNGQYVFLGEEEGAILANAAATANARFAR